ncbi:hypothetical protein D3C85_1574300 [compost metagenome]
MCKQGSLESLLIHEVQGLTCQEVKTIQIIRIRFDRNMMIHICHLNNRLKDVPVALLNKLTHGVKIS